MELASINIVVNDADEALATYIKLFGTNNIAEIIKLKGLRDDREIVDMGASEFAYLYLGDLNGDFKIDLFDLAIFANYWLVAAQ